MIVAAVGLVFLLIFILRNLTSASVHFLGTNGTLPMGVAILLAAVGGALLLALLGSDSATTARRAPAGVDVGKRFVVACVRTPDSRPPAGGC